MGNKIAKSQTVSDFLIPQSVFEDTMCYLERAVDHSRNSVSLSRMSYSVLGEEYRCIYSDEGKRFVPLTYSRIRVTTFIGTEDWQFVGFLERVNGSENKLSSIEGNNLPCPPFFRESEFVCDCCRNKGNRKYLFIMQNRATGWMKKIGYECLNSFAGSKILSDYKHYEKLFQELRLAEKAPCHNSKGYYPIRMILRTAIQLVDKHGYIKEGEGNTKETVCKLVSSSVSSSSTLASTCGILSPYERPEAELDHKVDRVWNYYSQLKDPKSDYETQLKDIFGKYKAVPYSRIGLIASAYRKSR